MTHHDRRFADEAIAEMRDAMAAGDEADRLQALEDEAAQAADEYERLVARQDAKRDGLVTGDVIAGRVPARFKAEADWSVPEILEHRGGGTGPETDEYRAYVRRVNLAAGLEAPAETRAGEDMTAEDHFNEIRRHRRPGGA